MFQDKSNVIWNKKKGDSYFILGLKCNVDFSSARPGQFVMLRLPGQIDPLLSRPFSIYNLIEKEGRVDGIEILIKKVGKGTDILSQCKTGDSIEVLGPLGSAFIIPGDAQRVFLVAGGIGVAPLAFLASEIKKTRIDPFQCHVFVGGQTKTDLLCTDEFTCLDMPLHSTTDDGSEGEKCLVTDPLEIEIKKHLPEMIYACGPKAMLECVIQIAEHYGVNCQVSIETMMACGMGACLGCAVEARNTPSKYLHVCQDGPVFNSKDIILK